MGDQDFDCKYPLYDLSSAQCAGQGTCIGPSVCACDEGWTGLSDWINLEGENCQINKLAVMILYSISLAFFAYSYAKSAMYAKITIARFKKLQKREAMNGRKMKWYNNNSMLALFCGLVIYPPGHILFCVSRLIDDEQRIGVTWPITIGYTIIKIGFYAASYFYQPQIISALLKGRNEAKSVLSKRKVRWSWILATGLMYMNGPMAIAALLNDDRDIDQIIYLGNNGIMIMSAFLMMYSSMIIKKNVVEILDESYITNRDDVVLAVKERLVAATDNVIHSAYVTYFIYICVSIPMFWVRHDYFYPVLVNICPLSLIRVSRTLAGGGKKKGANGSTAVTSKSSFNESSPVSKTEVSTNL